MSLMNKITVMGFVTIKAHAGSGREARKLFCEAKSVNDYRLESAKHPGQQVGGRPASLGPNRLIDIYRVDAAGLFLSWLHVDSISPQEFEVGVGQKVLPARSAELNASYVPARDYS